MKISKKLLSLGLTLSLVLGYATSINAAVSNVSEIKGGNRYETAAKIADNQKYTTAILVNSDKSLADGLSASGLSGAVNSPILLTKKDTVPNETLSRLKNVEKVYVIGGPNAISSKVENQLKSKGIKEIERIQGNNRIETSYKVAKEISKIKKVDKIILTNGTRGEADAMSASSVAARDGAPIILTNGQSLPFDASKVESYVIGSSSVMSDELVKKSNSTRLGGKDRYDTNKKVVEKFYKGTKEFYLSKGDLLVDALTASPLAKNSPVVLVKNYSDKTILNGATKLTALGGIDTKVVDQSIQASKGVYITQNMEIHFIDVGQGDATYIELADGTDILIDAGESKYGNIVVNYLKNLEKDIDIEYLIATHPDSDHIGGMQQAFKDLKIKNFYYPQDAPHNTQTWNNVLNLAKNEGCSIIDAKSGTTLNLGGAVLKFVHPNVDYKGSNEDSVVALLDYNDTEVLLTGDAEAITEQDMVNQNLVGYIDVLKVGHHGSNSSSTQTFLNKVKPENSVISVGKDNNYGHPTSEVLNRLVGVGSKVWRTDKNGNIVLSSDGYTYNIKANGNPQTGSVEGDNGNNNSGSGITENTTVYVTPSGKSYHSTKNCTTLKRSTTILSMTLKEAKNKGKSDPCNVCVK
ncbi:cell wall-binding repeat-containing protein [Faecalimicrobium sp. JNUCC 81]